VRHYDFSSRHLRPIWTDFNKADGARQSDVFAEELFAPAMPDECGVPPDSRDQGRQMRRRADDPRQREPSDSRFVIRLGIGVTWMVDLESEKIDSHMCKTVHRSRSIYFLSCDTGESVIF
jgi:hypothetical protein